MRLVSITPAGAATRLRRYETTPKTAELICTHEGAYASEGITAPNVLSYFDYGAPQDRIEPRNYAWSVGGFLTPQDYWNRIQSARAGTPPVSA